MQALDESAVEPHQVIEVTLEALQVPAMICTSYQQAVLHFNRLADEMFKGALKSDADAELVWKELGWDWDRSQVRALMAGQTDEVYPVKERHLDGGRRVWTVCSWLPEIPDWPPAILLTAHHGAVTLERAREMHCIDRLAVIQAVMLDQLRADSHTAALFALKAHRKINATLRNWMDRMPLAVEHELPSQ